MRNTPFGKKPVSDSRIIPASKTNDNNEDLDVPSFLRKKI
jgi:hypothetical protein